MTSKNSNALMDIIKSLTTASSVIPPQEKISILSPNNAEHVPPVPSTAPRRNHVSAIVSLQSKSVRQLKNVNAPENRLLLTTSVNVLLKNPSGMGKIVLPAQQEPLSNPKINNAIIALKDLLLIQSPIVANQDFDLQNDLALMYFRIY
jgi:hypothetical protein